jgi:hypothetical protein
MRKPRSPATLYGFVLASSGIYAFFWAVSLMEDLNELLGSPKFNVTALRTTVVISLLVYALSVLHLLSTIGSTQRVPSLRWLALAMGFGLFALLIWLVLRVHREIGLLTSEQRTGAGSMIWLTLMFLTSLPILQTDINRLLSRAAHGASAGAEGR